jgi:hypothetical protein
MLIRTLLLTLALPIAAAAQGVIDVPMLFRGPEPAVEVMVNGRGPFLFAIDTGATDDARIDSSLIEKLGLRVSGTDMVGDGSSAANSLKPMARRSCP